VPAGAQAVLDLPATESWLESGTDATHASGVIESTTSAQGLRLRLGSGTYQFSAARM
jgi:hypothetical protein